MGKKPKLSKHIEIKNKMFEFFLAGNLKECAACIKILNALDLDEQGIKFLWFREEETSRTDNTRSIRGLIEVEKGTTIEGMRRFFRALDAPFWDCFSLISLCEDVNVWHYEIRLVDKRSIGVVIQKGTLTVPAPANSPDRKRRRLPENLPGRKRRSRWDT